MKKSNAVPEPSRTTAAIYTHEPREMFVAAMYLSVVWKFKSQKKL